ncbi:MAG: chromosome segregation protein SMC [Clostridiales bacterium]|nr:chromosome segregation protein SMC [Clostridiales bacterium]
MVLKTLEMQGFKSFPDKTVLNFGSGITAVVGPNGSGKSNIAAAVRWVLGETSTKSLRGSKMEDVIFGGTSARKALGFAQVQLTLDNCDRTLKDKGDIVTVTRRHYRSGESEYKIDSESVRRRDIHELFMDTGLGSSGYSMVGQGKIDSILSQKNEDRRELFEEAAGISFFRHKRTDASRRLDQAQENLVRLLDILGELESRVEPLKKQSEKAQKFIELSDEKKTLEIGVWLNKINRFTNELREQEHKTDALSASYDVCEKELKDIAEEVEKIAEDTASINMLIEQIRSASKAYEDEAAHKESDATVIEATISHNNDTIQRLKNDIDSADSAGASIDAQIKKKNNSIEENELLAQQKRSELQSVTEQMNNLISSNEEYSKLSIELNQKINALSLKLSDCRVKYSRAVSSAQEIESRQSVVDASISEREKEIELTQKQKEESTENLKTLNARIDENNNSLSGYQIKLESKTNKVQKIKDKLDSVNNELMQKQSRARMLLDLEKNMEGYSSAVKAVIKQSQSKALSGIHGVLSRLISVDNEYSVALEIALGAAMQNIVTSNETDAKRAIYYLKNNRLGRATFLPVSAVKPRTLDEKGLDDNFGFVAVASDLVKCDKQYSDIISNLLGRVVIVEDMDCAIGISKRYSNRLKLVTLDGQVINPGGSMTGGSQSKGAGILSRGNQIDELNAQAAELQKELDKLKTEYKAAVEDANFSASQLQGAQADLQQAKEELIRAQGENRLICEKLDSLLANKRSLENEKSSSVQRITALESERIQSEKDIALIEANIQNAESQLQNAMGSAQEINDKRETYRQKSEEINLTFVTLAKDTESARISVEELKQRKSTESDKMKSIESEINSISDKNKELTLSAEKIRLDAKKLREQAKQSDDEITLQINRRNDIEKHTAELRNLEKEKNLDREKLSGELVRLEERKLTMQKEYDELNNMLFEKYELTRHDAQALNIVIDDMPRAKKRLLEIKLKIKSLGSINVGAIEEYKEISERYAFLKEQIDDVKKSKSELLKIIEDLTASMSEKFLAQFNKIDDEFKVCFADFFGGGKGELVLEDESNCLESPIEIKIQPPGKSVQNINLFSGGEKSLAAMALLFSVLKVQPAPFCIYDEVEAALDDVNVERFAKYMRKMTDKTQFISITHRRGTMEEADVLYGVTMQEKGVSKLIELQTAEFAAQMGLEE